MQPIVGYHVLTNGDVPLNVDGVAYTYVLAADGIYVRGENAYLRVTVPVAAGEIRGLRMAAPGIELKAGRIPQCLWRDIVTLCEEAARCQREVLCEVVWRPERGHGVRRPRQIADASALAYERDERTVLQLHSHHGMPAFFSPTDDRDEQGLGLYGVLGRLGVAGQRPEVILRVGIYGHYQTLPWDAVFEGELGDIRDLTKQSSDAERSGDVRRYWQPAVTSAQAEEIDQE